MFPRKKVGGSPLASGRKSPRSSIAKKADVSSSPGSVKKTRSPSRESPRSLGDRTGSPQTLADLKKFDWRRQRQTSSPQLTRQKPRPSLPCVRRNLDAFTSSSVASLNVHIDVVGQSDGPVSVSAPDVEDEAVSAAPLRRVNSEPCIHSWDFNPYFKSRKRKKKKKKKKVRLKTSDHEKADKEKPDKHTGSSVPTAVVPEVDVDAGMEADDDVVVVQLRENRKAKRTASSKKRSGYLAAKIKAVRRKSMKSGPVILEEPHPARAMTTRAPPVREPLRAEDEEAPVPSADDEDEMQVPLDDDEEQEVSFASDRNSSMDRTAEMGSDDEEHFASDSDNEDVKRRGSSPVVQRPEFRRTISLRTSSKLSILSRSFELKRSEAEQEFDDKQDAEDDEGFMQTRDAWSAKLRDDRLMRREVRKEHDDSGNEKSMHATVASLVDGLANERTQDNLMIARFLSTYQYFVSSCELLHLLMCRFLFNPPEGSSDKDLEKFKKWSGPVRLRVINVMKKWMEGVFPFEDETLTQELMAFINKLVMPSRYKPWGEMVVGIMKEKQLEVNRQKKLEGMGFRAPLDCVVSYILLQYERSKAGKGKILGRNVVPRHSFVEWTREGFKLEHFEDAEYILSLILEGNLASHVDDSQAELYGYPAHECIVVHYSELAPKTFLLKRMKTVGFLDVMDVPSEEFARQLTLIEQDLFSAINPSKDLIKVSDSKSKPVADLIDWSNRLSSWVASEIVQTANLKKRVAVLKRFIAIAEDCFTMKNFSSMTSIALGLGNVNVTRLKKTWKALPRKILKANDDLQELTSVVSNFSNLRTMISKQTPPLIPYFALFLKDLSLMELGNPSVVEGDLVNWSKFEMIADVFSQIDALQQTEFVFRRVYSIWSWLRNVKGLSPDELERQSNQIENRYTMWEDGADDGPSTPNEGSFLSRFI